MENRFLNLTELKVRARIPS